jgi:hypothetical protein
METKTATTEKLEQLQSAGVVAALKELSERPVPKIAEDVRYQETVSCDNHNWRREILPGAGKFGPWEDLGPRKR